MKTEIFRQCQKVFPEWSDFSIEDFEFDNPKGFSSFTMGIRCKRPANPPAVLYRQLEGKENAILDFATEKEVFLALGEENIAAHCHYYGDSCRIEAFYQGRTLLGEDLFEPGTLRQIADQLYRLHQLRPTGLPPQPFFELMQAKWGLLAQRVLEQETDRFPANERAMCRELRAIYSPETLEKVNRCLPDGELTFCHNDTYHGNIMKLDNGQIKLLDFEFSCLNHKAYDFANLFAETVMRHQLPDYPHFEIAEPEYSDAELALLIDFYLDNESFTSRRQRQEEFNKLLSQTTRLLIMSDYKYALAALPLAVEPIQKIRFIPYAYQRFKKFLAACDKLNESV
jgi:thiamine kinase-like enzyme